MENASRALIMAGEVLIGVLIISLAVYLFIDFGSTSAQINTQNAEKQVTQFNTQFTSYEGKEGLTIYDIITVAGYAKENNDYYSNNSDYKVEIKVNNISNFQNLLDNKNKYILEDQKTNGNLPTYECQVISYHDNGRISVMKFKKN